MEIGQYLAKLETPVYGSSLFADTMYASVITNDKHGVRRAKSNYLHTLFKINDINDIK